LLPEGVSQTAAEPLAWLACILIMRDIHGLFFA
jgi:hypothetical protein